MVDGYICSKHNMVELNDTIERLKSSNYLLRVLIDDICSKYNVSYSIDWLYDTFYDFENVSEELELFVDCVKRGVDVNPAENDVES